MKTTAQDPKRTKSLLQHKGVRLHDIQSFSFMKRFREVPRKSNLKVKDKYGAGILTLHLKQGSQKAFYVRPFQKPSSIIRFYLAGTDSGGNSGDYLSAPVTLYVLFLCAFHHVHDIGISGYCIRKLVGIYSGHHFVRSEYLLHAHADDTLLLSESRQ